MAAPRNRKKQLKLVEVSTSPHSAKVSVPYIQAIQLLESLVRKNSFVESELVASQIIDCQPKDPAVRLLLLESYTNSHKGDLALTLAHEILDLYPKSALANHELARYFINTADTENALTHIKKALSLEPRNSFCHFFHGHILSLMGNKSAAIEAYTAAIRFNPMNGQAHYGRARLTGAKASAAYIDKLENLIKKTQPKNNNLCCLHYAAALSYNDENSDRKFEHLDAANSLSAQHYPWDRKQADCRLSASRNFFQQHARYQVRDFDNKISSPIFIASMPRSGTTLLETILSTHSHNFGIGESQALDRTIAKLRLEINLSPEFDDWSNDQFERLLHEIYVRFTNHPMVLEAEDSRVVEKSMTNIENTPYILLAWPQAKIVHLKRHPLDVILSCYETHFEGTAGHLCGLENLAHWYSMQNRQIEYWKLLFPERIHSVDYESLVNDNEGTVRALLDFCNLPWEFACLTHNKTVGPDPILNASSMQVREPIHTKSVQRWERYRKHMKPAADILKIDI
ncbi:MAG: sulfotransferase [Halioglobus sp.]